MLAKVEILGWTESKIPEVQSQQCVTYPSQYRPNNHQPNEQMELPKEEKSTRECSIQWDYVSLNQG